MLVKKTKSVTVINNDSNNNKNISEIDIIRLKSWMYHVFQSQNTDNLIDFEKKLLSNGVMSDYSLRWDLYSRGVRCPSVQTLGIVEDVLGVQSSIYTEGELEGQWRVLQGDYVVCKKVVNAELKRVGYREFIKLGMPMNEKIRIFYELLIPKDFDISLKNIDKSILKSKNITKDTSPIQAAYLLGMDDNPEINKYGIVLSPSLIIAVIAMWQISRITKELYIDADIMLSGILADAILYEFPDCGIELKKYLTEKLTNKEFYEQRF